MCCLVLTFIELTDRDLFFYFLCCPYRWYSKLFVHIIALDKYITNHLPTCNMRS